MTAVVNQPGNADRNEAKWYALGYGRCRKFNGKFNFYRIPGGYQILTPIAGVEFVQYGTSVQYRGEVIATGKTMWDATWNAVGYFFTNIVKDL